MPRLEISSQRYKLRARFLLLMGSVLIIAGAASVGFYSFEAWSVAGAADQSMTFWMLPFLLVGLLLVGFGAILLVFWRLLVKAGRKR